MLVNSVVEIGFPIVNCATFVTACGGSKHTMLAENSSSIHSGHFMVSCIYEADEDGETVPPANALKTEATDRQAYNFEAADRQLRKTYVFGSRSTNASAIDASLTKLFECMTLAYR